MRILIDSDAHRTETLANTRWGIATARRAWLTPDDVANTRPWKQFAPLRKRAGGASGSAEQGGQQVALDHAVDGGGAGRAPERRRARVARSRATRVVERGAQRGLQVVGRRAADRAGGRAPSAT